MRKLLINSALTIGVLMLAQSCNSDFKSDFGYKEFVQWSVASTGVDENAANPITITVQVVGKQRSSDVTIDFDVAATNAVEGVDFEFPGGKTLVIPANSSTATLTFKPIDNGDISEEARSVTLTIVDAGGLAVDVGAGAIKIAINEDDFWCPRNQLANLVNTETDVGYSSAPVSIEKSTTPDGCLKFDIIGGGYSLFGTSNIRFNGVTLEEDSPESTTGIVKDGTFQFFTLTGAGPYTSGGQVINMTISNGVYDLTAGTIQFDYEMFRGTDPWFPGTLIYDFQ